MRLIWSRPARDDLFEIAEFYHAIDPLLAVEILDRIAMAANPLLDNPQIGSPIEHEDARKWRAPGTPYLLMYATSGTDVEVRRVQHVASNWRPR